MTSGPAKPWFAAKRYGYGAGLPIAWQGWAVLAGVLAAIIASTQIHGGVGWALRITALAILVVVCALKTEGGWRWRWGKD